MKALKPPLLIKYTPNEKDLEECNKLGKNVAEQALNKSR
jgi:flavorubredoxin